MYLKTPLKFLSNLKLNSLLRLVSINFLTSVSVLLTGWFNGILMFIRFGSSTSLSISFTIWSVKILPFSSNHLSKLTPLTSPQFL